MKKLYFLFFLVALTYGNILHSQTFQLKDKMNGNAIITNNQIFYHTTTSFATISHDMELKNLTSSPITMTIRKYEDLVNTVSSSDMALLYFCTGTTCYNATVSIVSFTLAPNEAMDFKAYIDEASIAGASDVRYKFANGSEELFVELKYNTTSGLNENASLFASVSEVYPNPVQSDAYLNVFCTDSKKAGIRVINSLGSVVYTTETELTAGKNLLQIATSGLASGIYYVNLSDGKSTISKKITVTK